MTARRAPCSPQAVTQTLSVIYSLCSSIDPYLQKWSITFVPLLPTYYLWAITLKQSLSDQSDCIQLAVERVLRNRLLGARLKGEE